MRAFCYIVATVFWCWVAFIIVTGAYLLVTGRMVQ